MKSLKIYEADDKMISLIKDNYSVLQSLGAFDISLGFGDKTVAETCQANGVDTYTFLAVVNYTRNNISDYYDDERIHIPTLLHYLKASHAYFLDFQLPAIRRELHESISQTDAMGKLIMKFYDDYSREIRRHMKYEEKTLFPYVESLLAGSPLSNYNIDTFSKHHGQTDQQLRQLKLMIIKYLPGDPLRNSQLTATLYDIYNNEEWLRMHADVEDHILTPAIKRLEHSATSVSVPHAGGSDILSERERDVVIGVVEGLLNKEIADRLCISVNTVITHRRNIARKLQIHSPAGLTIYAIVNGLVDISSVKL